MGAVADIIQELKLPFTEDDIKVDVERVNALFRSSPMPNEKANSVRVTYVPTGVQAHWIGQNPQRELLKCALRDLKV